MLCGLCTSTEVRAFSPVSAYGWGRQIDRQTETERDSEAEIQNVVKELHFSTKGF